MRTMKTSRVGIVNYKEFNTGTLLSREVPMSHPCGFDNRCVKDLDLGLLVFGTFDDG